MSVHIRRRTLPNGDTRYDCRYRRGGRGYPLEHAGTFTARKHAQIRADLVAGWLAAGKDPRREFARLRNPPPAVSLAQLARDWRATRHDVAESTRRGYQQREARIVRDLGDVDPLELTPAKVSAWVANLAAVYKPGTVELFVTQLRMILDTLDLAQNPARHRLVQLPAAERLEVNPPDATEVVAFLTVIGERWRLPLIVLEQTAMRVSELVELTWGNVDRQGARFRVVARTAKTRRSRWVDVPSWLMPLLGEGEGRVFPGFERRAARNAMAAACGAAGVAHYHPHDLRHRRATLWHQQGVYAAELARRLGHSRPSMSLDVYSHVMPLVEVHPHVLTRLAHDAEAAVARIRPHKACVR